MAHSASLLNSKSEFDSFLFAPVGEDKRGTVVSVLTAFARLDSDPWLQAADFARLPKEAAKTRLAAMIATLPGMLPPRIEPGTTAARLVALLPAPPLVVVGAGATWLGATQPANFRSPRHLISIAVFMALGFGAQLLIANLQSPATSSASTQTAGATDTQSPTPSQGDAGSATGSAIGNVTRPRDIIDLRGNDGKAALAQPAQQRQASDSAQPVPVPVPVRRPLFGR